jgi:hypothetical protein
VRQTQTGTAIARTPAEAADSGQLLRVAKLTFDAQGHTAGTLTMTYRGTAAIEWRQIEAVCGDAELRKRLKEQWGKTLPSSVNIDISSIDNLPQDDEPLTVVANISGSFGLFGGEQLVVAASLFETHSQPRFQLQKRDLPVYFPAHEAVQDVIQFNFPASIEVASLPEKKTEQLPGGSLYEISFASTATTLTIHRTYILGKLDYPASDYASLEAFYAGIAATDRESIVFKHFVGDVRGR